MATTAIASLPRLSSSAPPLSSIASASSCISILCRDLVAAGVERTQELCPPTVPSTQSSPAQCFASRPRTASHTSNRLPPTLTMPPNILSHIREVSRFGFPHLRKAPLFRSFAAQAAIDPQEPQASSSKPQSSAQQREGQPQQQQPEALPDLPPNDVVYFGPLSQQHKLLKRISIANTLVAFAAAPAILVFAEGISLVSRYGLAASLVFFGVATTGALHWVANPYVHELRYCSLSQDISVRTATLLGRSRWHHFPLSDVKPLPWNRPVATFMANNRFYYIDVFSFPDEQLLRRLTPDEADVPKGYKEDDDDD